jgi:hypothetical protein
LPQAEVAAMERLKYTTATWRTRQLFLCMMHFCDGSSAGSSDMVKDKVGQHVACDMR